MKIFKRIIATLIILSVMASFFQASAADVAGDMNGDGKLKLSDVRAIMRIASDITTANAGTLQKADVNSDGEVTLLDAYEVMCKAVDVDIQNTLKGITQITPDTKHGSSTKSKFCMVTEYSAETLPASPINDTSNPLYSTLPKGTYDYVASGPVKDSSSGKSYYVLKSGRRVYTDDVKVFTGYAMPSNKAQLRYPTQTDTDSTDFYIALNWRVPFNVTVKPQSYETGYDSRKFNNAGGKFTATYMDITFYYTTVADGALTFPNSGTVKSCKWIINDENKTATLRVYFRETGGFYGYEAYYNSDNLLVISVKEPVKSLKGRVIELDPGHGGADPGALSSSGAYESTYTYKIASYLKTYLENKGATVVMSRDTSSSADDINERRMNAIKLNPDLYVAIHLDSSQSSSANGASVYYYKNYSGPLAEAISDNLIASYKTNANYSMKDKGVHFYPFCVTRVENCPAVLIESGFISNSSDFGLLKTANGQKAAAKGIYNGILEYFNL